MKKTFKFLSRLMLIVLAMATGASGDVLMANATAMPDAGVIEAGDAGQGGAGISTVTAGQDHGDPDFYLEDVDKRIVRIRPMATPIDQISRYAKSSTTSSLEVKYYSVGTREITCITTSEIAKMTSGASTKLPIADENMFTVDDTIRVVGVKAITNHKGVAYDSRREIVPDLVLCVCGKDATTNQPIVYAVNGEMLNGQPIGVPAIAAGTTLVRMGKACGELDVQTGRFNSLPTSETQYCQNFMMQVEQSTLDKIAKKEVNWSFTDIEEDGVYDMRVSMENSFLFGDMNKIKHVSKDNMAQWFTKGIWWMAGKDIEVGVAKDGKAVITDDNLVDITKELFVGTGIGNKKKILFCGSDMLSAFSKIQSEKFRLKESVEAWHLKFKSWDTDFGEVLTIHHELFDLNGMSDCGFALDPDYLSKKTHVSWSRSVLDLQKAGVRRTDAVVIQEISCLYLRNAKAHARMKLVQVA